MALPGSLNKPICGPSCGQVQKLCAGQLSTRRRGNLYSKRGQLHEIQDIRFSLCSRNDTRTQLAWGKACSSLQRASLSNQTSKFRGQTMHMEATSCWFTGQVLFRQLFEHTGASLKPRCVPETACSAQKCQFHGDRTWLKWHQMQHAQSTQKATVTTRLLSKAHAHLSCEHNT